MCEDLPWPGQCHPRLPRRCGGVSEVQGVVAAGESFLSDFPALTLVVPIRAGNGERRGRK